MSAGRRLRLAFVSPIFLFPTDAGGKIRTTNILRGLKGGAFDLTLLSPASPAERERHAADIASVCDRFVPWDAPRPPTWRRVLDLAGSLPVNVAADRSRAGLATVAATLAEGFDLVVFDFVHAAVLRPPQLNAATLCFTHNVEAEIFARHAQTATRAAMRWIWARQAEKMRRFEAEALAGFTSVVAVSERDAAHFTRDLGLPRVGAIPTGVDLDFFAWADSAGRSDEAPTVVFTGSMDSAANIGGVEWFLDAVWPLVLAQRADARFVVVGRNPPAALVARGAKLAGVRFTGSVPDVRPFVREAQVFVIPLLVGGGTRIKAFEAMAMGCPVVSTRLGIEGLDVEEDRHFVARDDGPGMAQAIVDLLADPPRRRALALAARERVEQRFGHAVAAAEFERLCLDAVAAHGQPARGA